MALALLSSYALSSKSLINPHLIFKEIAWCSSIKSKPLVGFFLIAMALYIDNLFGICPTFDNPFAQPEIALEVACLLMLGIIIRAVVSLKSRFVLYFMPEGSNLLLLLLVALEVVALLSRVLSLGIRLAVNLNVGSLITHIIIGVAGAGLIVLTGIGGFLFFEMMIAYLQAYIFTFIVKLTYSELTEDA